ncbi:hypothetical protein [Streptomyces sp. NPDC020817]
MPAVRAGDGLRVGEAIVEETWAADEYGYSYEGHIGALLEYPR